MGTNTSANIHAEETPCWIGTRKSRSLLVLLGKSFGWQGMQWIWESWGLKYNQRAPFNARLVLEGAQRFSGSNASLCLAVHIKPQWYVSGGALCCCAFSSLRSVTTRWDYAFCGKEYAATSKQTETTTFIPSCISRRFLACMSGFYLYKALLVWLWTYAVSVQ